MKSIPSGKVTFLFTDIEGSTKLAQDFPELLPSSLIRHHEILKLGIESNNGFVFEIIGDAFCAAFSNVPDALKSSLDIQQKLSAENWGDTEIKVRMGIHTGNAEWDGLIYANYILLARTQRIMSAAHGGQILISSDVYELAADISFQKSGEISFRDFGERRLKDLSLPVRLYQVIAQGLREEFPPINSLDARPNNLPIQLTNFIGKKEEIQTVKQRLNQTHLLTLTGAGGSGKTRLALQIGADVIDEFQNGVWFVDLAQIVDESLLPQKFMISLEIAEDPLISNTDTVINFLKKKNLLIIIDNCEHLINASSELVEKILLNCPGSKIIATSREALKCSGETLHRVSSLSLPDLKGKATAEILCQYESVKLFIDRAVSVNSNFTVTNSNAPALADICHRLDGIPLAIELAAARIKVLSVEQIQEKLSDRFKLLTGGKRTALPRQQTLKALIDWSFDLLSDNEKILWRRLSVFPGGWNLQNAEEICSDENLDVYEILDLISGLLEKSVIVFNEPDGRYKMLETIRQYGEEKLKESGEAKDMWTKQLKYYVSFAEKIIPELTGNKARYWLDNIEAEHSNIQVALYWAVEDNLTEDGCRLVCALGKYWEVRSYVRECANWLEKFLAMKNNIPDLLLAKSLKLAGIMNSIKGNFMEGQIYLHQALEIFRKYNDIGGITSSLNILGLNACDTGEYSEAKEFLNECLELIKNTDNKLGIANTYNSLGLVCLSEGKFEEAKELFNESLKLSRAMEDSQYIGIGLNNLAQAEIHLGNSDTAEKLFEDGLKIEMELNNQHGIIISLSNIATIASLKGDTDKAFELLNKSLSLSRAAAFRNGMLNALLSLGQLYFQKGEHDKSKDYFKECWMLQKDSPEFQNSSSCLLGMAGVINAENSPETSAEIIGSIQHSYESSGAFMDPDFKEFKDTLFNSVKDKLGTEESEAAFERGKSLSIYEMLEKIF